MFQKFLQILFLTSLLLGQFGAIPLFPGIYIYAHDIFLVLLLCKFLLDKRKVLPSLNGKLIKPISIFIGIGLVSLVINTQQFSNLQVLLGSMYLFRFLLYALLYVYVVNTKESPIFWQKSLYQLSVVFALLGLVQYWLYPSLRNLLYLGWDEHLYRLFSTLLDPNYAGIILVMGIFLGFYLQNKFNKVYFLTQSILFVSLILTVSRSAFLGFALGLVIYFLYTRNKISIVIGIIGLFSLLILPMRGIDTNSLFRVNSSIARIENINDSIHTILRSPIIGIGFNNLRALASREKMLDINGIISRDAAGVNSSILFVLITTGIIGLLFYLNIIYKFYKILVTRQLVLRAVGLATMSALAIHSVFNNSLFYPWVMIWLWILWGSIELEKKAK